jgi:hypothetical protein
VYDWFYCSPHEIVNNKFKSVFKRTHSPQDLIYVQYIPNYSNCALN